MIDESACGMSSFLPFTHIPVHVGTFNFVFFTHAVCSVALAQLNCVGKRVLAKQGG